MLGLLGLGLLFCISFADGYCPFSRDSIKMGVEKQETVYLAIEQIGFDLTEFRNKLWEHSTTYLKAKNVLQG